MAKRKKDREHAEELYGKEEVIEIKPSAELIREDEIQLHKEKIISV